VIERSRGGALSSKPGGGLGGVRGEGVRIKVRKHKKRLGKRQNSRGKLREAQLCSKKGYDGQGYYMYSSEPPSK